MPFANLCLCLRLCLRPCLLMTLLASAGLSACAEETTLTGSIGTSHDLVFDAVALRLFTDQRAFELRYMRDLGGGGQDVVTKIVFDVPDGGVVLGDDIDLLAHDGVVQRVTASNDPFPPLQRGTMTFLAGGIEDGDETSGRFATTFDNGRTLNGTFAAPLEAVRFDDAE
jgi:hypothetical protein